MDIIVLGKPIRYNPANQELTLQLAYTTDDMQAKLEQEINEVEETKLSKILFKTKQRMSITELQRKQFFVDLHKILNKMEISPNAQNTKVYRYHLLEKYAPVKWTKFGDTEKPLPPSINNLTKEEAIAFIDKVRDIHEYLKIDWEQ